jgi:hypothetical protein
MQAKQYLKYFFVCSLLIFFTVFAYMVYFNTKYPIPVTDRISFDAKLKFVRDQVDPDKIDTVIIGSSIGLNNLLGTEMENHSSSMENVLNLSVYGATALESEQLMQLTEAFPRLSRVIYSAQYSDMPHVRTFKSYHPKTLVKYMRHELDPISYASLFFHACSNLFFCYERQKKWHSKHMRNNVFESLVFDSSGSVPLHIYGKDIIGHRWRLPHPGIMHVQSFQAIERMAKWAKEVGFHFYVVHQPYRLQLYQEHQSVREAMHYFDIHVKEAISKYGGDLITVQPLGLDNRYFADRTHLNDKGSTVVSKYVAHLIDKLETKEKQ